MVESVCVKERQVNLLGLVTMPSLAFGSFHGLTFAFFCSNGLFASGTAKFTAKDSGEVDTGNPAINNEIDTLSLTKKR